MKKKIKILRIISTLNPNYGGPTKATIDSSIALIKQNIKVDIVTCDPHKSKFFKVKNLNIINKGPAFLGHFFFSLNFFFWLIKNKEKYDFFIIHGIWAFKNLAARLILNNNYSVFIHGNLHPEQGKGLLNRIKKIIYWKLFERGNLLKARSIILTSDLEKYQLNNTFVNTTGINKTIIKYGLLKNNFNKKKSILKFNNKFPFLKNKPFYLYLGRIHKQKGADVIIEAVNKIKGKFNGKILIMGPSNFQSNQSSGKKFEIYLKYLVKKYNLEKQIFFSKAEFNNIKWGAIHLSRGMVLPSHGENFGISLAESLSIGKPVLTTFKVNIYKIILKHQAGFVSRDNAIDFSKILFKFHMLNKEKIKKFSKNSLLCFKENFDLMSKKNSLSSYIKDEIKKNDKA